MLLIVLLEEKRRPWRWFAAVLVAAVVVESNPSFFKIKRRQTHEGRRITRLENAAPDSAVESDFQP